MFDEGDIEKLNTLDSMVSFYSAVIAKKNHLRQVLSIKLTNSEVENFKVVSDKDNVRLQFSRSIFDNELVLKDSVMKAVVLSIKGLDSRSSTKRKELFSYYQGVFQILAYEKPHEVGESKATAERRPKYKIVCGSCGNIIYRSVSCSLVKHPEKYKCSLCGGSVRVEMLSF